MKTLMKLIGGWMLRTFDRLVRTFDEPFDVTTGDKLGINHLLTTNREAILQEYLQVARQIAVPNVKDFYVVETDIKQDENWKGLPLLMYNHRFENNIAMCPVTMGVVRQIPGCTSVMFSVLGPGKHIPPHKGIYSGVYRCLFGLSTPAGGKCWIRVNDTVIPFEDGKNIIFDESTDHEVKNESEEYRMVLYLDVYRKLPFPLNLFNTLLFHLLRRSYYISNIAKEYARLEAMDNYKAAVAESPR